MLLREWCEEWDSFFLCSLQSEYVATLNAIMTNTVQSRKKPDVKPGVKKGFWYSEISLKSTGEICTLIVGQGTS